AAVDRGGAEGRDRDVPEMGRRHLDGRRGGCVGRGRPSGRTPAPGVGRASRDATSAGRAEGGPAVDGVVAPSFGCRPPTTRTRRVGSARRGPPGSVPR